ncbi:MAG TPA: hypothetical protein VFL99_09505 [Segeticoccus sp.]|nr:hypothetical protein [Segeticoccus sp.]
MRAEHIDRQLRSRPSDVTSRTGSDTAALLTSTSSADDRLPNAAPKVCTDDGEDRSTRITVTAADPIPAVIYCLTAQP